MGYIVDSIFNYLILMIFFILIEIYLISIYKKQDVLVSKGFIIGWQLCVCLVIAILTITGTPGIEDLGKQGVGLISLYRIDLIPFNNRRIDMYGLTMNVILFMPIGIIIPLLWKQNSNFMKIVLLGFTFSMMIEVSQLFNHRATDIDDLLMNTLGTVIGYGIYYLFLKKITIFQVDNDKKNWVIKNSPILSIIIIFLFNFFIGNSILRFIWEGLYTF